MNKDQLQIVIDALPVSVYYKDEEGRFRLCNKVFCQFFSINPENIIGKTSIESGQREQQQHRTSGNQNPVEQTGEEPLLEKVLIDSNGKRHTVLSFRNAFDLDIDHKRQKGYIGVYIDITRRKITETQRLESERCFNALVRTLPDAVFLKDREGRWLIVNPRAEALFGLKQEDWYQHTDKEIAERFPRIATALEACIQNDQIALDGKKLYISTEIIDQAPGKRIYMETSRIPLISPKGTPEGIVVIGRDVTEQRTSELQLRQAAFVFDNSSEGIMVADNEGIILSVNRALTEMTGYSAEQIVGMHIFSFHKRVKSNIATYRILSQLDKQGIWRGEVLFERLTGERYPTWTTISMVQNEQGQLTRFIVFFTDISLLKKAEKQLKRLANYDPLTGLPNRTLLNDRLDLALKRARRSRTPMAILFLDLDGFKAVNDNLGHPAGDKLLQTIAKRLQSRLRAEDTVSRFGGDEFVVIVENLKSNKSITNVAETLLAETARPIDLQGFQAQVSTSIGIALFPRDGTDPVSLIKAADTAMYKSKELGGSYCFYNNEMANASQQKFRLKHDLQHALVAKEFELWCQPQIDLKTGRISGVEALIRWRKGKSEIVSPRDFIPFAEETGLIVPIGEWVIEQSCIQAKKWLQRGISFGRIAVNISAVQFERPGFESLVMSVLEKTGLPPHALELELTERVLLHSSENAIGIIERLDRIGVTLSIDDFGVDYSSLSYLKRLAISRVKIDKGFIDDILSDRSDLAIVRAIIAMGRGLDFQVTAEGTETKEQVELLRAEGCDTVQGFYFARPMPAKKFVHWLTTYSELNRTGF